MRTAHFLRLHAADLPAAFYRVAGILAAVIISSSVWLLALTLASNAAGIPISTPVLTGVGLVIAALCLVCLAPVVVARR